MPIAKIHFEKLIQDSQDYGSDNEHMVSRVFFCLEIQGTRHEGLCANIKQSVGSSFESSPLEISSPENYEGPFNYERYRERVETYYRSLVGVRGRGIRITDGSSVRMRNNTLVQPCTFEFVI